MRLPGVFLAAAVAAILTAPASAAAEDERWTPWLGCWERVSENVIDSGTRPGGRGSDDGAAEPAGLEAPRACVTQDTDGVTITTTVHGQDPITQTIVADGSPREIADRECRGTERMEWSANGRRLYARAEATCGREQRAISGMGFITSRGDWLDIRSFRIDGLDATRVSRYRRVDGRAAPGTSLSIAEIKEASARVAAPVLEAALAESRWTGRADSAVLVELADANVPPSVIDVIVALSYPDRFRVATRQQQPSAHVTPGGGGTGFHPFYPAYYYSPFGFQYIGYYDQYLFGPYFYPGYSYYPGGGGGGSVGPGDIPRGRGRAIQGVGYTRIVPADDGGGSGAARPRSTRESSAGDGSSAASSSGSSGGSGSSSSGSGGGSASPGGYSSGGGGGDGGRTAQPR